MLHRHGVDWVRAVSPGALSDVKAIVAGSGAEEGISSSSERLRMVLCKREAS
jgi:hypothetical protein